MVEGAAKGSDSEVVEGGAEEVVGWVKRPTTSTGLGEKVKGWVEIN